MSHNLPDEVAFEPQNAAALDEMALNDANFATALEQSGFDSVTRRRFLTLAAATGAAVATTSGVAHADILDSLKKFLDLDPIVLNYAHELEEFQADFFSRFTRSIAYQELEARERSVINAIALQDHAQFMILDGLRAKYAARAGGSFNTRNASSSERPRNFQFPASAFRNRQDALTLAVEIKGNAVAAYHGSVNLLRMKKGLLEPAAAIAGVDGRHLAVLREVAGVDPIPMSFEMQISPQVVGNRLAKYGFKGGAIRGGEV